MGRGRISLMDSGGLQTRFAAAGKERKEVMMRGEVALGFRLYAIRDVSHMTHSFHAVFRCFYDWVDPNLALKLRDGSIDEAEWTKDVPEVSFTNASALQAEPWTQAPRVLDATTGRLYIHRRYEATLTERLELHRFPFDAQQLTIYMQLSSSKFRQYSLRLLPIELRGVPSIPGWSLLIPEQFRTEAEKAASLKAKAVTTVKLRVRREAGFFVRSILFTEGLLTTLSVIAFTLSADGVWDRVELQLALIFAILALRFSCADAVPVVPYATILDAYQNSCIVMLVMLGNCASPSPTCLLADYIPPHLLPPCLLTCLLTFLVGARHPLQTQMLPLQGQQPWHAHRPVCPACLPPPFRPLTPIALSAHAAPPSMPGTTPRRPALCAWHGHRLVCTLSALH